MLRSIALTLATVIGAAIIVTCSKPVFAKSFLPTMGIRGKTMIDQVARGDFDKAVEDFDATMAKALPPTRLAAIWAELQRKAGPFKRISNVRTASTSDYRYALVTRRFTKQSLDAKIVFSKDGKVAGLFFVPPRSSTKWSPPKYARRDAFVEIELSVGAAPWILPGTVTVPRGPGPFPAVVLVHGSGPNNRDESVGAIRVFKDIAWGLASNGIVVLRYDKRTLVYGKRLAKEKTSLTINEETVNDAVAAVALLKKQRAVDAKRVYLLGHSLGAMIGPRIAAHVGDLGGLILLAGNTRPTPELVVDQVTYLAELDGKVDKAEQAEILSAKRFRAAALSKRLKADSKLKLFGTTTSGRYWLDLRDYAPASAASRLKMAIFVGQGKRDYQVTVRDFDGWKRKLGERSDVTFRLYPRLNHLLVAGKGKSTPAEYEKAGNVEGELVKDLVAWITERSPR